MNVALTWRLAMWKAYDIWRCFYSLPLAESFIKTLSHILKLHNYRRSFLIFLQIYCDMEYSLPPPPTDAPTSSVVSEMTGDEPGLSNFAEQEESSIMESPKRTSSEWTDEKHNLYLKSMEASFVDQLYNSLYMRCWQTQNESLSNTMSSRKVHAGSHYTSGEFKVLQHGSWSRMDFSREKTAVKVADRPRVSSRNPWIQHFRRTKESPTPLEKSTLTAPTQQTTYSNTEVTDQNFVEEDSAKEKVTTPCGKKRKNTCAVSKLGNDQAASFWHVPVMEISNNHISEEF